VKENGVRLTVNRRQIQAEVYGRPEDPPVVLLHHGLGSVYSWQDIAPALAQAGFRVVAYDRWGYGGSDERASISMPFFSEDLDDLEELLDMLGIERAALVGHSDGGTIALYFAARLPERVSALVTVAAHIYVEEKMEPGIEAVRRSFERDARFRTGLESLHGDKVDAVFQNWYGGWRKPENLNWDMRPVLRRIECPVLVVQGIEDEHATPQHARDIAAAIPQAELWLVEEQGHMLPQEMAAEFTRRVVEFLNQNLGR
jgi:pimeloyl-ACP methyl ester carboxylesterase